MKKIILILSVIVFLLSCEKKADFNANFVPLDSNLYTNYKFINAYPYATPVFSGQTSSSVLLTHNGLQFSSGTPITVGTTYPASIGYAALFKQIAGLPMDIRMVLGTQPALTRDSLLFTYYGPSLSKYYSLFFCDSIKKPNSIFVTEDDLRLPGGPNLYRVRFVNLIPNPPTLTPAIDVYSTNAGALIFTGIPFKKATPFLELPRNSIATTFTDTYQIRWTGTSTVIATLSSVQLNNQMSLTLFAKGFVGATGLRAPGLLSYRNN
ncbi:MAG: DUF4397 domain-containing protein [Chitinophagaceae bacterium]|nr:DUF4397 domain-containing protein [Chitinophagaceae bacterium]